MSISLADLSPATLDCLADLIEQRLDDPEAALVPATWHDAAKREDADRDLVRALRAAGLVWIAASAGLASEASAALH